MGATTEAVVAVVVAPFEGSDEEATDVRLMALSLSPNESTVVEAAVEGCNEASADLFPFLSSSFFSMAVCCLTLLLLLNECLLCVQKGVWKEKEKNERESVLQKKGVTTMILLCGCGCG